MSPDYPRKMEKREPTCHVILTLSRSRYSSKTCWYQNHISSYPNKGSPLCCNYHKSRKVIISYQKVRHKVNNYGWDDIKNKKFQEVQWVDRLEWTSKSIEKKRMFLFFLLTDIFIFFSIKTFRSIFSWKYDRQKRTSSDEYK